MQRDTSGYKMHDKLLRFDLKTVKTDDPAPTSYQTEQAYKSAYGFKGKMKIVTEKRTSFTDREAMKSLSPGPAKHHASIK